MRASTLAGLRHALAARRFGFVEQFDKLRHAVCDNGVACGLD